LPYTIVEEDHLDIFSLFSYAVAAKIRICAEILKSDAVRYKLVESKEGVGCNHISPVEVIWIATA
jgi:hypothetical protein